MCVCVVKGRQDIPVNCCTTVGLKNADINLLFFLRLIAKKKYTVIVLLWIMSWERCTDTGPPLWYTEEKKHQNSTICYSAVK